MKNERPVFDLKKVDKATDQQIADMLDNDTRFVGNISDFKRQNIERWERIRELRGKVGMNKAERTEELRKVMVLNPPKPDAPLSAETLAAREAFSEAKVTELLAGEGAAKLKVTSAELYKQFQLAARSYGKIGEGTFYRVSNTAKPHPKPDALAPAPPAPEPPKTLTGEHSVSEWVDHFTSKTK